MKSIKFTISLLFILAQVSIANAQNWVLDLDEAKKIALESNRNIILVFSGSDWCAPCMKLEKEIWVTEEFKNFAEKHYVMVKADFPKRKENKLSETQEAKNGALAEKYNINGYFPLVVIMNKEGKVLGNTGYKKLTPKEYIDHLNSFIK